VAGWARRLRKGGASRAADVFPRLPEQVARDYAEALAAAGMLVDDGEYYTAVVPGGYDGSMWADWRARAYLAPDKAVRRAILALLPAPLPAGTFDALAARGVDPGRAASVLITVATAFTDPGPAGRSLSASRIAALLGITPREAGLLADALVVEGRLDRMDGRYRARYVLLRPDRVDMAMWALDMLPREQWPLGAPLPDSLRAMMAGLPDGARLLPQLWMTWLKLLAEASTANRLEGMHFHEANSSWEEETKRVLSLGERLGMFRVLASPDGPIYSGAKPDWMSIADVSGQDYRLITSSNLNEVE
jgi:hypothetical protein